jgi:AraC family transcriptional regulator
MGSLPTVLSIRNMVCDRCIRLVREELTKLGLDVRRVELGEAEVADGTRAIDLERIRGMLAENGFELLEDRRKKIIEAIKVEIVKLVHRSPEAAGRRPKLSTQLSKALGQDYHGLSTLFSTIEGITIEQYFIEQRIERVKELLKYGEQTLSEIAWHMGYSSVQHLSNQFRQVTGMTPTAFRTLGKGKRKPLDKVGS